MSRTFRKQPTGRNNHRLGTTQKEKEITRKGQAGFLEIIRDGQQTWRKLVRQDSRVTGLQDHQTHRTKTGQQLQAGENGEVRTGKARRYGSRHGKYEL